MTSGALLFGRYAFPPNQLGYCGPPDYQALFEYVAQRRADRGVIELGRRFEGAYPYLRLIAQANGIPDPFDRRVVEAYWVGNACLGRVRPADFGRSLGERFKGRMDPRAFRWLAEKPARGAVPHHNFHVYDVYIRAGLMRDERATIALETMDACRVSWGRVVAVDGAELVVERPALRLREGKLALAEPRIVRVTRQIDGMGFADEARPGDHVSIHWHWACEVLRPAALRRLQHVDRRCMALANETI
jgi:hypothetical protein